MTKKIIIGIMCCLALLVLCACNESEVAALSDQESTQSEQVIAEIAEESPEVEEIDEAVAIVDAEPVEDIETATSSEIDGVEETETEENEQGEYTVRGKHSPMVFGVNAYQNGCNITDPSNQGGYVNATALYENEKYNISYYMLSEKVYMVELTANSASELSSGTTYMKCLLSLALALDEDVNEENAETSVLEAIANPGTTVVTDNLMFDFIADSMMLKMITITFDE